MSLSARRLYLTLAALAALMALLTTFLVRRGFELTPVRGLPAFDLDEPPRNER